VIVIEHGTVVVVKELIWTRESAVVGRFMDEDDVIEMDAQIDFHEGTWKCASDEDEGKGRANKGSRKRFSHSVQA